MIACIEKIFLRRIFMLYKTQLAMTIAIFIFSISFASPHDSLSARTREIDKKIAKLLNLSNDQNTKLMALHEEMKNTRKNHIDKFRTLREKSRDELMKPAPDKKVLYSYAEEIGKEHKFMAEEDAEYLLRVKAILNDAQFRMLMSRDFMKKVGPPPRDEQGAGPDDK
jgi:hypothetical protein